MASDEQRVEQATRVVDELARAHGLDVSGARVLRVAASVLVELPQAAVIARVESDGPGRARQQVAVARAYEACGAPTAIVLPDIEMLRPN